MLTNFDDLAASGSRSWRRTSPSPRSAPWSPWPARPRTTSAAVLRRGSAVLRPELPPPIRHYAQFQADLAGVLEKADGRTRRRRAPRRRRPWGRPTPPGPARGPPRVSSAAGTSTVRPALARVPSEEQLSPNGTCRRPSPCAIRATARSAAHRYSGAWQTSSSPPNGHSSNASVTEWSRPRARVAVAVMVEGGRTGRYLDCPTAPRPSPPGVRPRAGGPRDPGQAHRCWFVRVEPVNGNPARAARPRGVTGAPGMKRSPAPGAAGTPQVVDLRRDPKGPAQGHEVHQPEPVPQHPQEGVSIERLEDPRDRPVPARVPGGHRRAPQLQPPAGRLPARRRGRPDAGGRGEPLPCEA
ncbi:hypothetical protein QJS66_08275 [Kocuria rhizophila]|nr:hypothetical protein QJS66_08275 [Kocuria rhizophila]